MRLTLVLLPVLAAWLTTIAGDDGNTYTLQADLFTEAAFSTSVETSLAHCTARCSRFTAQLCNGVRYGMDGLCELLVGEHECLTTSKGTTSSPASYRRRRAEPYCRPGWKAFQGSCYIEQKEKKSWPASRESCKDIGADLVSVNDDLELTFLLNRIARPRVPEWISPKVDQMINADGSSFETSLPIKKAAPDSNCIILREKNISSTLSEHRCRFEERSVCELRRPPCVETGCPKNWLQTKTNCFLFIDQDKTFHEADTFCSSVHGPARLWHPRGTAGYAILVAYANQQGLGTRSLWVGVTDQAQEKQWEGLTNPQYLLHWVQHNPQLTVDTTKNCAALSGKTKKANTFSCDDHKPFICKMKILF